MKPYERSELGAVGEGMCAVDRAESFTQRRDDVQRAAPVDHGVKPGRRWV
jgi:hypothetical protein